ncbi:putative disease resistance RPP13-like protein 3 [Pistacia vera]|uniref:putative disease resistance RPP13-like protein 3 n=1 Tax=Pistacia vera TaxID=55513 RepID=UPI0012639AD0|nr:putative disease resistance RPP13-like protein 3 [Pistacia vera]XP_031263036.1 putative disease resistance RPP13-like protein 3 [Pistacia vera]
MEDQAEENLNKLINRSLIQIGQASRGRIKTCRVHDLLRDLAIRKAEELKFVCINDEAKFSTQSSKSFRRQAFNLGIKTDIVLQNCNPLCRSLLLFNHLSLRVPTLFEALVLNVCRMLRVVKVLDIENCINQESESLPEEIGKLIHLKYLGLGNASVIRLPPSIGKLSSLQTLDLQSNPGSATNFQLPTDIGKLTELELT